jgi:hypothetical protein
MYPVLGGDGEDPDFAFGLQQAISGIRPVGKYDRPEDAAARLRGVTLETCTVLSAHP